MRTERKRVPATDEDGKPTAVWRIAYLRDVGGLDGESWMEVQCGYETEDGEHLNKRGNTLTALHTARTFRLLE